MTGFDDALKLILAHEGGYVNNPRDPGGETNLGVTRRVWQDWTGRKDVNMHALTAKNVAPLYRARYWDVNRCDELPAGVALCVFDMGVNAGPGRAAKILQKAVGAAADGKIGPATLKAVYALPAPEVIRRFSEARRAYYRALDTFQVFGRGWLRRVDETETAALRLA